jgi:uncharacterized protein YjbI with pentapeptide repeats
VANKEHLKRLERGIEEWNEWMSENPSIIPDLSRADLSGFNLSGTNLSGANLRDTYLRDANLSGANLSGTNLSGANLSGTNLSGANLRDTDLRDTDLSDFNLNGANLSGADLSGADLRDANLSGFNLSGTNLSGAYLRDTDLRDANLSGANLSGANLSHTRLSGANLSGANLSGTDLSSANLRDANLSGTDLSSANLSGANLSSADLRDANLRDANLRDANLRDANLRDANLRDASLNGANLRSINLSRTDLRGTDLSGANLSFADLSGFTLSGFTLSGANLIGANLSHTKTIATSFLNSDLTSATLTGACIQDWNINSGTQLDNVKCEYVYLKGEYSEQENKYILSDRRPSNPNAIFAPGEFAQLFQKALETVDLIFADGIDWQAFFQSFQELRSQYNDENLSIQAIEKKSGGAFVIRLEVPPEADKGAIENQAKELYTEKLKLLESSYQAQLQMQGEQLEHEKQRNSQLMRVVEVMAENTGPKYDLRHANIGNMADTVKDNARQQTNQYNYESPEKQSLAEAATEIQRLLKVLEASNPTATEADQKAFVSAGVSPTMKQRAVGALQSGGKAALEEFLDNPYVNVGVAIVEGWREAK